MDAVENSRSVEDARPAEAASTVPLRIVLAGEHDAPAAGGIASLWSDAASAGYDRLLVPGLLRGAGTVGSREQPGVVARDVALGGDPVERQVDQRDLLSHRRHERGHRVRDLAARAEHPRLAGAAKQVGDQ